MWCYPLTLFIIFRIWPFLNPILLFVSFCTECYDKFKALDNTIVEGGRVIWAAATQEECKRQCLAMSDCRAYDFYSGGANDSCRIHSGADLLEGTQDFVGASHNVRIPCKIPKLGKVT